MRRSQSEKKPLTKTNTSTTSKDLQKTSPIPWSPDLKSADPEYTNADSPRELSFPESTYLESPEQRHSHVTSGSRHYETDTSYPASRLSEYESHDTLIRLPTNKESSAVNANKSVFFPQINNDRYSTTSGSDKGMTWKPKRAATATTRRFEADVLPRPETRIGRYGGLTPGRNSEETRDRLQSATPLQVKERQKHSSSFRLFNLQVPVKREISNKQTPQRSVAHIEKPKQRHSVGLEITPTFRQAIKVEKPKEETPLSDWLIFARDNNVAVEATASGGLTTTHSESPVHEDILRKSFELTDNKSTQLPNIVKRGPQRAPSAKYRPSTNLDLTRLDYMKSSRNTICENKARVSLTKTLNQFAKAKKQTASKKFPPLSKHLNLLYHGRLNQPRHEHRKVTKSSQDYSWSKLESYKESERKWFEKRKQAMNKDTPRNHARKPNQTPKLSSTAPRSDQTQCKDQEQNTTASAGDKEETGIAKESSKRSTKNVGADILPHPHTQRQAHASPHENNSPHAPPHERTQPNTHTPPHANTPPHEHSQPNAHTLLHANTPPHEHSHPNAHNLPDECTDLNVYIPPHAHTPTERHSAHTSPQDHNPSHTPHHELTPPNSHFPPYAYTPPHENVHTPSEEQPPHSAHISPQAKNPPHTPRHERTPSDAHTLPHANTPSHEHSPPNANTLLNEHTDPNVYIPPRDQTQSQVHSPPIVHTPSQGDTSAHIHTLPHTHTLSHNHSPPNAHAPTNGHTPPNCHSLAHERTRSNEHTQPHTHTPPHERPPSNVNPPPNVHTLPHKCARPDAHTLSSVRTPPNVHYPTTVFASPKLSVVAPAHGPGTTKVRTNAINITAPLPTLSDARNVGCIPQQEHVAHNFGKTQIRKSEDRGTSSIAQTSERGYKKPVMDRSTSPFTYTQDQVDQGKIRDTQDRGTSPITHAQDQVDNRKIRNSQDRGTSPIVHRSQRYNKPGENYQDSTTSTTQAGGYSRFKDTRNLTATEQSVDTTGLRNGQERITSPNLNTQASKDRSHDQGKHSQDYDIGPRTGNRLEKQVLRKNYKLLIDCDAEIPRGNHSKSKLDEQNQRK